jgi:hypothetical protein
MLEHQCLAAPFPADPPLGGMAAVARSLTALAALTERGLQARRREYEIILLINESIIPLLTSYKKYLIDYRRDMC